MLIMFWKLCMYVKILKHAVLRFCRYRVEPTKNWSPSAPGEVLPIHETSPCESQTTDTEATLRQIDRSQMKSQASPSICFVSCGYDPRGHQNRKWETHSGKRSAEKKMGANESGKKRYFEFHTSWNTFYSTFPTPRFGGNLGRTFSTLAPVRASALF